MDLNPMNKFLQDILLYLAFLLDLMLFSYVLIFHFENVHLISAYENNIRFQEAR